MVTKIVDLLGCNLSVDDIVWVQKLCVLDQEHNQRKTKPRVLFKEVGKKIKFF